MYHTYVRYDKWKLKWINIRSQLENSSKKNAESEKRIAKTEADHKNASSNMAAEIVNLRQQGTSCVRESA